MSGATQAGVVTARLPERPNCLPAADRGVHSNRTFLLAIIRKSIRDTLPMSSLVRRPPTQLGVRVLALQERTYWGRSINKFPGFS